ncbi:MAG: GDP-mannose 4,6-dehydratase, partial [Desulfobacterales bacterium]|nr:GDP-mannose 4,6-dehydratase [Desulfobacterales bacterium]
SDVGGRGQGEEIGGAAKPRHLECDATASDSRKRALRAGDVVVEVDPSYFRPTEVDYLQGDASKAKEKLKWKPRISFNEMVSQMVKADLEEATRDQLCMESGFRILDFNE